MSKPFWITIVVFLAFCLGGWVGMCTRHCILTTLPKGHAMAYRVGGHSESLTCYSEVQGKRLKWQIGTATLLVTPPWSGRETNPPPLSPDRAIAASRQEVPKYLADAEAWQVDEIRLQTLGQEDGWYYVIEWRRTDAVGDSLSIPVLMSGVAVPLTPDTE